ncbi:MAG: glycosyltransferase family 4 protein [Candidatus Goldbacteria bacterium]|nr:glycosyltransferase family 4 protein [Candidatus Goldiibacteriota bacterium]
MTNIDYYKKIEIENNSLKKEIIFLKERLFKIESGKIWRLLKIYFNLRDKIFAFLPFFLKNNSKIFFEKTKRNNQYTLLEIKIKKEIKKLKKEHYLPIVTNNFLKEKINNHFYGGNEKYIIYLLRLMNKINKKGIVFQFSKNFFKKTIFNDNIVIGVGIDSDHFYEGTKIIQRLVTENFNFCIYSPYQMKFNPEGFSIGISHGLYNDFPGNYQNWIDNNKFYLEKIMNHNIIVSVDTATLNWLRALNFYAFMKCIYIPNFVDLDYFNFKPGKDKKENIILFPRSLYEPRGIEIFLEAINNFLIKNKNYKIYLCGEKVDKRIFNKINSFKKRFYNNLFVKKFSFEKIRDIYKKSKIVVVPSLHSEGTSLSLLEAMSCGCVPIATWVGGLTDIIINNYNGLLIKPTAEEIFEALKNLVNNDKKYKKMQKNAKETVREFSLKFWEKKWLKILKESLKISN